MNRACFYYEALMRSYEKLMNGECGQESFLLAAKAFASLREPNPFKHCEDEKLFSPNAAIRPQEDAKIVTAVKEED